MSPRYRNKRANLSWFRVHEKYGKQICSSCGLLEGVSYLPCYASTQVGMHMISIRNTMGKDCTVGKMIHDNLSVKMENHAKYAT